MPVCGMPPTHRPTRAATSMPAVVAVMMSSPEMPPRCWPSGKIEVSVTEPLWPPAPTSSISKPCTAVPFTSAAVGAEQRSRVPQIDASPDPSISWTVWRMRIDQGMPAPSSPAPIVSSTSSFMVSTTSRGMSANFRSATNSLRPRVYWPSLIGRSTRGLAQRPARPAWPYRRRSRDPRRSRRCLRPGTE